MLKDEAKNGQVEQIWILLPTFRYVLMTEGSVTRVSPT